MPGPIDPSLPHPGYICPVFDPKLCVGRGGLALTAAAAQIWSPPPSAAAGGGRPRAAAVVILRFSGEVAPPPGRLSDILGSSLSRILGSSLF